MTGWKTEVITAGGEGNQLVSTTYKTYSLKEAAGIINQLRAGEQENGKEKRKIKPVTRYLLEELIQRYFRDAATRGEVLETIIIKDMRQNGTR